MVNFLPTIRLAQLILKRKFPSVDKPLKKAFEKHKLQGLFSEFYGILIGNHVRVKSSELAPGLANAQPLVAQNLQMPHPRD